MQKTTKLLALLAFATMATLAPSAHCEKAVPGGPNADVERGQTLLMNLQTQPRSAGYFILHSIRGSDDIFRDLEKALKQIEAVDATYAKSRNHPDDRYLNTVRLRLTAAKQTAGELHSELEDCWGELKDSIKQTLVTDPNFKPDRFQATK
jgi:hypothetical protein